MKIKTVSCSQKTVKLPSVSTATNMAMQVDHAKIKSTMDIAQAHTHRIPIRFQAPPVTKNV